jgi:hypothetical protein
VSIDEAFPVDVYPVGLLADLVWLRMAASEAVRPVWLTRPDACEYLFNGLRTRARALPHNARHPAFWHGFHAEPQDTTWCRRAGRGWTQTRARRDLARHILSVMGARYRDVDTAKSEDIARLAASVATRWQEETRRDTGRSQ